MLRTRRVPRVALVLVAVALLLRLGFVIATPGYTPAHDDRDFEHIAAVASGLRLLRG